MSAKYNQVRAMFAITRASLKAIFRSPSAIVFSFMFPLIFILVFGFIGGGGKMTFKVGFHPTSDTSSLLYSILKDSVGLAVVEKPLAELESDLERGRITAILTIVHNPENALTEYTINMKTSGAVNVQNSNMLRSIINTVIHRFNMMLYPENPSYASLNEASVVPGRVVLFRDGPRAVFLTAAAAAAAAAPAAAPLPEAAMDGEGKMEFLR